MQISHITFSNYMCCGALVASCNFFSPERMFKMYITDSNNMVLAVFGMQFGWCKRRSSLGHVFEKYNTLTTPFLFGAEIMWRYIERTYERAKLIHFHVICATDPPLNPVQLHVPLPPTDKKSTDSITPATNSSASCGLLPPLPSC